MVQNVVEVTDEDGNTQEVRDVFELDYHSGSVGRMRDSPSLGEATIVCANSRYNRSFTSGSEIEIKSNGETDFSGFITNQPSNTARQSAELEIGALDKRSQLKFEKVNRTFYQMDTAEIIRQAVLTKAQPRSEQDIFLGETLNGWDSNLSYFSNGAVGDQSLTERAGDFIFLGFQTAMGGEFQATYRNVSPEAVNDGNLERLDTRLLVNNKGEQFAVEIELRDHSGNNYNWTIAEQGGRLANGFETYELKPENAVTEPSFGEKLQTDGAIRYRFKIDGRLPGPRAAAIDYASTIPFKRETRDTVIDPSGVVDRNADEERIITRRFDGSVRALIQDLSVEEGYVSRIDTDNTLYYVPTGSSYSDLSIEFENTPVVDAKFDRDYQRIKNKVRVQGKGNVRVTVEDTASIKFYGVSAREEAITDSSIQTEDEAISRGRGYLEKHSWHAGAVTFEIADVDYQSLVPGQNISVEWPPEELQGTFLVNKVETDDNGIVTVELTK